MPELTDPERGRIHETRIKRAGPIEGNAKFFGGLVDRVAGHSSSKQKPSDVIISRMLRALEIDL